MQPAHEWEDTLQDAIDGWSERLAARDQAQRRRTSRSRSAERRPERTTVREQITKWQQMASVNDARRLEGLPKLQKMPEDIKHGTTPDAWEIDSENRMLVRHRNSWRNQLFIPTSLSSCPVPADKFTGKRVAKWLDPRGGAGSFVDRWQNSRSDPERILKKSWTGSSRFEIVPDDDILNPKRKEFEQPPPPTTKRKRAGSAPGRTGGGERQGPQEPASSSATSTAPRGSRRETAAPEAEQQVPQEPGSSSAGASQMNSAEVYSLTEADRVNNIDEETFLLVKRRIEQLQQDTDQGIKLNDQDGDPPDTAGGEDAHQSHPQGV